MLHDPESLRQQLLDAPSRFLSALTDHNALDAFDKHFAALTASVASAVESSSINSDLLRLASMAASRIDIVAGHILETQHALADLSLDDPNDLLTSNHLDITSMRVAPPCIPAGYDWLLRNAHDPYPPYPVKEVLAFHSGLSVHEITRWFKDVRRCIGWVDLCNKYFRGSRALAVEASAHVLMEQDPKKSLSIDVELEILTMWGKLESLYDDPQSFCSRTDKQDPFMPSLRPAPAVASTAVPVPEKGYPQSLGKRSYANAVEERPFKRHRVSIEMGSDSMASWLPRSNHRNHNNGMTLSRPSFNKETVPSQIALPSVPFSTSQPTELLSADLHEEVVPIRSRKRRSSECDSDSQPLSKRARGLPAGPRQQVVSDPLPRGQIMQNTDSLDARCLEAFSFLPLPASVSDVDPSKQLEVVPINGPDDEVLAPEIAAFVEQMINNDEQPVAPIATIPSVTSDSLEAPSLSTDSSDVSIDPSFWDFISSLPDFQTSSTPAEGSSANTPTSNVLLDMPSSMSSSQSPPLEYVPFEDPFFSSASSTLLNEFSWTSSLPSTEDASLYADSSSSASSSPPRTPPESSPNCQSSSTDLTPWDSVPWLDLNEPIDLEGFSPSSTNHGTDFSTTSIPSSQCDIPGAEVSSLLSTFNLDSFDWANGKGCIDPLSTLLSV